MLSIKKAHTREIVPSNTVLEGLNHILRHLDGYPFPRNIMTRRLSRQVEVVDKEAAMKEFELSNWQDCRIGAYPTFTEYHGLNLTPPSLVFIDLDLQNFKSQEALDRALKNILKIIQKIISGGEAKPTVLWTGNGYHIYFPIAGFILESEEVFSEFVSANDSSKDVSLSTKFMRFAEHYFTNGKQDPNHKPSVNNCLLRIPGTFNSKNGQKVRIAQEEWNGYKAPIQYVLREFRRYLIQKRIDNDNNHYQRVTPANDPFTNQKSNSWPRFVGWIDNLLQTPITDQRKYCIWRILAPYLVNVKQLSNEEAYNIIITWLDGCSKLERLSFYHRPRVKDDISRARKVSYYPISLSNLQKENPGLYSVVTRLE
jgi:hypothetical protein